MKLSIKEGKVIRRYFKLTPSPGSTVPPSQLEWTENENELNTHPHSGAEEAITMDQVYEKARTVWPIKREKTTTYFETKNNGIISVCGYVKDGCQDDCFTGIRIASIQPFE